MPKGLNDVLWGEFVFDEIFDIYATGSGIDKNKLLSTKGLTPYVTRSDKSNGIDFFIGEQNEKYSEDIGNVITIGLDTQTVFYQSHSFYTGQNIQILVNDKLTRSSALFLIPLIKKQLEKFSWGGNGATLTRLRRSKVLLPVRSQDEPDYEFMEQYTREKEAQMIEKYNKNLSFKLNELSEFMGVDLLESKKWAEFKIKSLFKISKGVYLPTTEVGAGNIPYITAKSGNNGLNLFIENKALFSGNAITIEKIGLSAYYQPQDFYCSHDVTVVSNDFLNKYNAAFICSMVNRQGYKYSYGRQAQLNVVRSETILLPINIQDEPDYEYMENYMKRLEYEKLDAYFQGKASIQ